MVNKIVPVIIIPTIVASTVSTPVELILDLTISSISDVVISSIPILSLEITIKSTIVDTILSSSVIVY